MKTFFKKLRLMVVIMATIGFIMIDTDTVQAQTVPPVLMAQINAELNKRGLTEAEVRVRLLKEGIDLENVPPDQLPGYQTRVLAILDKMEAEKKAATTVTGLPTTTITTIPVTPVTQATTGAIEPTTTKQEAAAEASQRVIQAEASKDEGQGAIYGHSLFIDKSLDVFRTTDGAQAPDTYVLGDGDEIRITIFGASQTDIQQTISPDGYIQPAGIAKIFLKGLTLAQARELIRDRLSSSYTFRSDQFAVTIVTARTIMVNVFGEAKITGGFTISALNSAFNALSAAGGPTKIGSVRDIQLIRGKTRKSIDVYTFMNDPATQFKFDLQNSDILFIPVVKLLVSIEGAVKRPMIYEMLPNETLTDLIKFAGDVNMNVFPDFVQIKRYVNGEVRLLEWNLGEVRSGLIKVPLANGDIVRIKSISKPMDQYVDIEGSVYYPGRYDISSNSTLKNILLNALPTLQAKTDILFVERTRSDETVEVLTIPFPDLQKDTISFILQPRDRIKVLDQTAYRDVSTITVSGQVRNPFEKTFALTDHLSVKQAIEMAGGLKTTAYPVAYIQRRNLSNPKEIKYIRIDLDLSENIELQAGDELTVYDNTTFTNVGEISVQGAVRIPFTKTFAETDRLNVKQAIDLAGGVLNSVYPVAYIFRRNLNNPVEIKYIRIELENADQIDLQPGDQLNIYDNTTFTNVGEVRVFGAVKNPRGFTFDPTLSVRDVLTNAGGFNPGAAFNRVEVFRINLSTTKKNEMDMITLEVDSLYQVVSPQNFSLQPYDQIVVRTTPEFTMGRTVEITGQVKYPGVYLLESKQIRLSNIIKLAGGLLKDADPEGSRLFRTYHGRGNISMNIRKALNNPNNNKYNPVVFEGDIININRLENTVTIYERGTRMSQYGINPEDVSIKNVVYQGPKSAGWYIRNFAGGFDSEADRNSVTVTLPNSQMKSTTHFLFFRNFPNAAPGSAINLKMKPPKIEKEDDKKKVDWNSMWSNTLSASTTALTLYMLISQINKSNAQ